MSQAVFESSALPHPLRTPGLALGALTSLIVLATLGQSLLSLRWGPPDQALPPMPYVAVAPDVTTFPRLLYYPVWQARAALGPAPASLPQQSLRLYAREVSAAADMTQASPGEPEMVLRYWRPPVRAGRARYRAVDGGLRLTHWQEWTAARAATTVGFGMVLFGLASWLLPQGSARVRTARRRERSPWRLVLAPLTAEAWVDADPAPVLAGLGQTGPWRVLRIDRTRVRLATTCGLQARAVVARDRRRGGWFIRARCTLGASGRWTQLGWFVLVPTGMAIATIQGAYAAITPWHDAMPAAAWAVAGLGVAALGGVLGWRGWRGARACAVAEAFGALVDGLDAHATMPPAHARRPRPRRVLWIAGAVAVLGLSATALLLRSERQAQTETTRLFEAAVSETRALRAAIARVHARTDRFPDQLSALEGALAPEVFEAAVAPALEAARGRLGGITQVRLAARGRIIVTLATGSERPVLSITPTPGSGRLRWDYCQGTTLAAPQLEALCPPRPRGLVSVARAASAPLRLAVARFVAEHRRLPRRDELPLAPAPILDLPGARHLDRVRFHALAGSTPDWGIAVTLADTPDRPGAAAGQRVILQPLIVHQDLTWHHCHGQTTPAFRSDPMCTLTPPWLADPR